MANIVGTFCWGNCVGDGAERAPQRVDRTNGLTTQNGLHFGEHHLDRIEVGAVWRQEQQLSSGGLDGLANGWDLVDRKGVHHDDVIELQRGNEHLLDIGHDNLRINRTVEYVRRDHAIFAQASFFSVRPSLRSVSCISPLLAVTSCVWASQRRSSARVASGRAFTSAWIAS